MAWWKRNANYNDYVHVGSTCGTYRNRKNLREVVHVIKRRIPPNYEFQSEKILEALTAWQQSYGLDIPPPGVGIDSRGFLFVNLDTITAAQATNLKQRILPLLSDVQDVTA